MDVKDEVQAYIVKELNNSLPFDAEADLIKEQVIDSLQIMKLLGFLEQQYGIDIELEAVTAESFATVSTIAEFVELRMETTGQSQLNIECKS